MKRLITFAICSILALPAFSSIKKNDCQGWVVGGGVGSMHLSIDPEGDTAESRTSESALIASIFGGYNFTPWFGIEFDVSQSEKFSDRDTRRDASVQGTSFSPKVTLPINESLSAYLKVGVQALDYKVSANRFGEDYDDLGILAIDPFIGFGLQLSPVSGLRLRLDYKYSELDFEEFVIFSEGEEYDVTLSQLLITVNYQF